MNHSIKVISKNSQENIIEINGSGKVAVHSADKIQILANNDSGILSLFGSKSQNTENLIAVKSGNNLEIILENGDVLTFVNFYNFKNATSIEFVDGDDKIHTLLSTDSTMADMGEDSFLVYTQGSESTLLSMSASNTSLSSALSTQFNIDTSSDDSSGGYGYIGLLALGAAAGGGGGGSSSSSSSSSSTGYFVDSAVGGIDYYINGTLAGQTGSDGSFSYNAGDTITFKVGTITVGDITASAINSDGKVMPQDLAGVARTATDDATVLKIAQFLQTLDSDSDPDTITIDATSEAKVDASGVKNLATYSLTDVIDDDAEDGIVSASEAQAHLNDSVNDVEGNTIATTFSGTVSDALDSTNLVGTNTVLTLNGVATASEISGLYSTTGAVITASAITVITGSATDIKSLIDNSDITLSGSFAANVTAATAAALSTDIAKLTSADEINITGASGENLSISQTDLDSITTLTADEGDDIAVTAATAAALSTSIAKLSVSGAGEISVTGANGQTLSISQTDLDSITTLTADEGDDIVFTNAVTLDNISKATVSGAGILDYNQITFLDDDVNSGQIISDLEIGDLLDLDADTTGDLVSGNGTNVDTYSFNQINDTLTWTDNASNTHTLVLTGVDAITESANVIEIATLG